MSKWVKIEERSSLVNIDSFEKFLTSDEAVGKGEFSAIVSCQDDGCLCIIPSSNELKSDNYYLLLYGRSGETRRLMFKGYENQGTIVFDISDGTLWTTGFWCLYIAGKNKKEYFISRLRTQEKIDWRYVNRVNGDFPESCLWQDKGRCLGIVAEHSDGRCNQNLVVLPDHRTSRVDLRWYSPEYAEALLKGTLWHHAGSNRNKSCPFEFSIVMPVYKAEDYIDEAIQSVLAQDIGFEKNIQLILVDDGSPDSSGTICDDYASKYPQNIIVIHKKNGGVSSARNTGKSVATGRYVNFLDSDDKLSPNTLTLVRDFFDTNYDKTDVVTIPEFRFGRETDSDWLNYKFDEGTRVIDLWKEPTVSCMSVASSFYKLDTIKELLFDERLSFSEDTKANLELLSEKMTLGVVAECEYWHRQDYIGNSLKEMAYLDKAYYNEWFNAFVFYIFNFYKEKYGFVPEFVQNEVLMNIKNRFKKTVLPNGLLSKREWRYYKKTVSKTLQNIDDFIIINQQKCTLDIRAQELCMKYDVIPEVRYGYNDAHMFCNGIYLCDANNFVTHFNFIRIKGNKLILEGYMVVLQGFPTDGYVDVYVMSNKDYYRCSLEKRNFVNENCFGKLRNVYSFYGELPIMDCYLGELIHMAMVIDGHLIINRNCTYGSFCPISSDLSNQYYWINEGLILHAFKQGIRLDRPSMKRLEYEKLFTASLQSQVEETLMSHKKFPQPVQPSTLTIEKYEEIVRLRHFAITAEKKRPIWLVSDRLMIADDNGAALFAFLMRQNDLPADVYFVIKKDSPDYERMADIGPVLDYGSEEHLKIHLIADLVISSQSEKFVITPFCKDTKYYGDRQYYQDLLSEQKYIFLQHGITINDVSKSLNRFHSGMARIVTSAARERQSFLEYPYFYNEDQIWLTGLPRFDLLYENPQKQVTIMPTWRTFVRRCTRQQFIESEFFQFYKSLITSPLLNQVIHEKGYHLCIKLHPELIVFQDLFEELGITVLDQEEPYRKIYAESNLIITDYSSASFDFSYMRKPVIYCQFDEEAFFEKHYSHGYFNYREDGFGPVTTTVDETVEQVIAMLDNECQMDSKYLDRCNAFFPVNDYHNCERVYQKLLEMTERNKDKI